MSHTDLAEKYRPETLDDVIGHEVVVRSLKGIIKSGKWPSAIAFFGPTSAGKTTLTQALMTSCYGASYRDYGMNYTIMNAAANKTLADVDELVSVSRLSPVGVKRRFIFIDEAQGLLSNPQAAGALLVPLEKPPASTTWILGSMEPEKFANTKNGVAILNRCTAYHLKPPTEAELHLYARRIIAGEEATFINKACRQALVENCNNEMRTLAKLIASTIAAYESMPEKDRPDALTPEDVSKIMVTASSDDDRTAVKFMTCLYSGSFIAAQRCLIDVNDGFNFMRTLTNMNWFVLNNAVLKGERHNKVWASPATRILAAQVAELRGMDNRNTLIRVAGMIQAVLVRTRVSAGTFSVPETYALSEAAFTLCEQVKAILPPKE